MNLGKIQIDVSALVAIYAAIIATATLGWNIINAIIKNKAKLKVEHSFGVHFIQTSYASSGPQNPYLAVTITNIGSTIRYLIRPLIKIPKKINGEDIFHFATPDEKFPIKLVPGEIYEYSFDMETLDVNLLRKIDYNGKIQVIACDTLNKKYFSDKIEINSIVSYLKTVREMQE